MIFGLGSGRCGTGSLAIILGLPHETVNLPWIPHWRRFEDAIKRVAPFGGDVSLTWLPYVDEIMRRYPDSRCVCLRRDKEATCRSWVRQQAGRRRFSLYSAFQNVEDGTIEIHSVFPDYGDISIEEAVSKFYDDYYERALQLRRKYPMSFRIYPAERVLNDAKAQREMLKFCRLKRPVRLGEKQHRADPKAIQLSEINGYVHQVLEDIVEKGKFGKSEEIDSPEMDRLAVLLRDRLGLDSEVSQIRFEVRPI